MSKSMKKTFLIFLALFLCIIMTACSAAPQNMPASPNRPTDAETTKPAEPDNTSSNKPSSDKSSSSNSNSGTSGSYSSGKSSSSYKSSNSFSNSYGTSKTKCAHNGCNNYIASSGDTNCCTTHSRRCLKCKKYIDEDALYCMSCLSSAVDSATSSSGKSGSYSNSSSGSSSNSYSGKSSSSYGSSTSKGCQYVYPNGSKCGSYCSNGKTLCSKHMKELTEIYNNLTK